MPLLARIPLSKQIMLATDCGEPLVMQETVENIGNLYMNLAKELDLDHAEAVLRVEQGSSVVSLTSKEIKRDLLLFAKNNAALFINLVKDENVQLRNFAIKAVEAGIIDLDGDQRNFYWAKNKKKLMTVPFEENPYSAFAAYLKTDEGTQVYKSIDKKLK